MLRKKVAYLIMAAILAGLLTLSSGCILTVIGSSNVITRDYNYSNFSEVEVGGAFEVEISRADTYEVSINADDNLFEYIDVSQDGKTLKIYPKLHINFIRSSQKAIITMPNLERLGLSGASKGKISGFKSSNPLYVHLSGASSLNLSEVQAGDTQLVLSGASNASGKAQMANCQFELSGASDVVLEGSGANLSLEASGASHLTLTDFKVVDVRVNLSGASSISLSASGKIDASLSGASRLNYTGNPTFGEINTSGASTISRL